jgi:putative MATE family efflux protein
VCKYIIEGFYNPPLNLNKKLYRIIKMDRSKQMGEQSISKLLVRFSVPAIVGMMVNALYNVVDRIFIGRGVGALGIAGATVGFPIMLILMAFGMLVGLGGNALVSIRLGQKKKEEAELILGNSFVLLVLLALVLTAAGLFFLKPMLLLFGASEKILPYAQDYLRIILLGSIFQAIGFGMNNFIRGEGNPKIAMLTMLIGAVLNTILDPIFIFVLGLGVKGAALATIISQAAAASWVLLYFLGGKSLLKIHLKNLRLNLQIVGKIISIGSAPFAMQLASSVMNAVLNRQLQTHGGDLAISTIGIIYSIFLMILMPIFGLNQGAQPIIGYNYGAQKYDRVKKTLQLAIAVATFWVIIGFVATQMFPHALVLLFNDNKELLSMGTGAMRIFLMMLPLIGFQVVSSSYFQAVGKPKPAMLLSLSRQVLFLIPLIIILPHFFGLKGIWYAGPTSDLLSSLLTGAWLFIEIRHLNKRHSQSIVIGPGVIKEED